MGKVRGAVERIDIPAVLMIEGNASSLFRKDAVRGKLRSKLLHDELFRRPVGFRNNVDVAFVFERNTAFVITTHERSGANRDARRHARKSKIQIRSEYRSTKALATADRRRPQAPRACSRMVRICCL